MIGGWSGIDGIRGQGRLQHGRTRQKTESCEIMNTPNKEHILRRSEKETGGSKTQVFTDQQL